MCVGMYRGDRIRETAGLLSALVPPTVSRRIARHMPNDPLHTDGAALIKDDPWLENYAARLRERHEHLKHYLRKYQGDGGLMGTISQGHTFFGFNRGELWNKPGVWYREWAPGALQLRLIGDFNNWNRFDCPLVADQFGVHAIFLPDDKYASKLVHGSKVKVLVVQHNSQIADRIPAYIRRVVQEPGSHNFTGQFWMPPEPYLWEHPAPKPPEREGLRVYEAHVGMSQEEGKVGSF